MARERLLDLLRGELLGHRTLHGTNERARLLREIELAAAAARGRAQEQVRELAHVRRVRMREEGANEIAREARLAAFEEAFGERAVLRRRSREEMPRDER